MSRGGRFGGPPISRLPVLRLSEVSLDLELSRSKRLPRSGLSEPDLDSEMNINMYKILYTGGVCMLIFIMVFMR